MDGTLEHLGEGRMGMDDAFEFLECSLACYEGACFLDYVGGMRSIEMTA